MAINARTNVKTTELDFPYQLPTTFTNSVMVSASIADIIGRKEDKTLVSLHCHLKFERYPTINTKSKFHDNPIVKKEICGNDDGAIKVILFGDHVYKITESDTYTISN